MIGGPHSECSKICLALAGKKTKSSRAAAQQHCCSAKHQSETSTVLCAVCCVLCADLEKCPVASISHNNVWSRIIDRRITSAPRSHEGSTLTQA
jgi:hypothetical protein